MRSLISKVANSLLNSLGLELRRISENNGIIYQEVHDPRFSYMKDQNLRDLLIEELAETARGFFTNQLPEITPDKFNFRSEVQQFWKIYSGRPFGHNRGGSGFHNAFWIYLFTKVLNPSLVVESGVWKGHISWLLEQACVCATIYGFDINFSNLEYKAGRVQLHEQDWADFHFHNVDGEKSFVFFDCHVNHAKRMIEAYNKGFHYLLFDDNPPIYKLYGYGRPGFPTSNMIYNGFDMSRSEVSWVRKGKIKKYCLIKHEVIEARKLIQKHEIFPDVGSTTRYGGFSSLTFVSLKKRY